MSKMDDIKAAASSLSTEKLAKLRAWPEEREEQRFDDQIERDATSGKLDKLAERAMNNLRAGRGRDL